MRPNKVRIWIYYKETWVRITCHADKEISFNEFSRHDEGWTHTCTTYLYEYDEGVVRTCHSVEGCDCDGRHSWRSEMVWPIGGDMQPMRTVNDVGDVVDLDIMGPVWITEREYQRDMSAEAMGY